MNDLFTVDHALNHEGWSLDTNPNNYVLDDEGFQLHRYYTVDNFSIRTRRNDFYLVLYIYNGCGILVFADRIETIEEYRRKVKRNLYKWRCTPSTSVTPTPTTQTLQMLSYTINKTYTVGDVVTFDLCTYAINEVASTVNLMTIPSLTVVCEDADPGHIWLNGTADTAGIYSEVITFMGATYGTIVSVTFNITINSNNYIVQENTNRIIRENGLGYLIQE
jgi:hypothetical protein